MFLRTISTLSLVLCVSASAFGQAPAPKKKAPKTPPRLSGTVTFEHSSAHWGGPSEADVSGVETRGFKTQPIMADTPEQFEAQLRIALEAQRDQLRYHNDTAKEAAKQYALSHTSHRSYHYNRTHTTVDGTVQHQVSGSVDVNMPRQGQHCGDYNCTCGVSRSVYWHNGGARYYCPTGRRWISITRGSTAWGRVNWNGNYGF